MKTLFPGPPLPHFTLADDLIRTITSAEMWSTVEALNECNLLSLPYPEQTLAWDVDVYCSNPGWMADTGGAGVGASRALMLYRNSDLSYSPAGLRFNIGQGLLLESEGRTAILDLAGCRAFRSDGQVVPIPVECVEEMRTMIVLMGGLLITALATKNIEQHTTFNKRAARGIGNGAFRTSGVIHRSVTRLSPPSSFSSGDGKRMPIHWRAGHVHRWRKGDGSFVSKLLPPILVNAARGGTPATPEYRVTA